MRRSVALFCSVITWLGYAGATPAEETKPVDVCATGSPWVLPPAEPPFSVSEQHILLGAEKPIQVRVCHCTPKVQGEPTPYVWVNIIKSIAAPKVNLAEMVENLEKTGKQTGADSTNTVQVSLLRGRSCLDTAAISVSVLHEHKSDERVGTYFNPIK
jgi:hypothetical protein